MNKEKIIQQLANTCNSEKSIYYLNVDAFAVAGEETCALPLGDAHGKLIGVCVVHSVLDEDGTTYTYTEEFECSFPNIKMGGD